MLDPAARFDVAKTLSTAFLLLLAAQSFGQSAADHLAKDAPYLNPDLTPERRAADVVSRMTLEEKVLQMQNAAPAIPRLKIPEYNWWSEALHGVAQGRATVFPQAIGLAATWDTDLMHRVADTISTEARAKWNEFQRRTAAGATPAAAGPPVNIGGQSRNGGLTYWSPNINIFRDPRWGRGQETYGEDPFLTARMGVAFVTGMQGNDPKYLKVVSTPKHYAVHSGPEPLRHVFDAKATERDMVDTYLPAFRAAIVEGKADSIMCVYNSVNGLPGCASPDLLQKRLREQWGFQGYVVSDCGAVNDISQNHKFAPTVGEGAVAAVKAGTDLTCGSEYRTLVDEVKAGKITEAEINRSVERLFVARFRLGMYDPPERVPFSKIPMSENDSAEHRKLALEAERKAIVLLKNEGQTLPLKSSVHKIAVIGPSADDPDALLGNYHGISSKQVTPLEGIQHQFAGKVQVSYALGATYTATSQSLIPSDVLAPPDGAGHGLRTEYFDNPNLEGQPKLGRVEPRVYFQSDMDDPAVAAAIPRQGYSVRWTGALTAPYSGEYIFGTRGAGSARLAAPVRVFLDDKELDFGIPPAPGRGAPAGPGVRRIPEAHVRMEAGHKYSLRVELRQTGTAGGAQLMWVPPAEPLLADAVKIAKDADVVLAFVGLSANLEGEEMRGFESPGFLGGDRTSLDLPAPQESLVEAAIATGKPVVVVLTSGSAISANYAAAHAAALMEAWYGGEELGTAVAQTIAGVNNPAGRLPVTFYKGVDQLPPFEDYAMKGRTYRYFSGDALYSFGFGLSYSTFQYSALGAKRTPKGATVSVHVKNSSAREGDEVVQLYVSGAGAAGDAIRQLRGFQRVHLRPGETRTVEFTIGEDVLPKGQVQIGVGAGQPIGQIPHLVATL
jgi:beta-glucosidase